MLRSRILSICCTFTHDGGVAEDRRHLPPQRSGKTFLLRRMNPSSISRRLINFPDGDCVVGGGFGRERRKRLALGLSGARFPGACRFSYLRSMRLNSGFRVQPRIIQRGRTLSISRGIPYASFGQCPSGLCDFFI